MWSPAHGGQNCDSPAVLPRAATVRISGIETTAISADGFVNPGQPRVLPQGGLPRRWSHARSTLPLTFFRTAPLSYRAPSRLLTQLFSSRFGVVLVVLTLPGFIALGAIASRVCGSGSIVAGGVASLAVFVVLIWALVRQILLLHDESRLEREAAERRLAALVHHASDMILVVESDGIVRYSSPSVGRVMRLPAAAILGRSLLTLLHEDHLEAARHMLTRLARRADVQESLVVRALTGNDEWRWLELVGTNRLETDDINGLVLNIRDVTHRRELESRLAWQAFHDPLTGLANRVLFTDRVTHALSRRTRDVSDIAVMYIDLDHFKVINDTFGHTTGDQLLRQVSRRIELEVRGSDTVARLGGDEFAILMEDADAEMCQATAERVLATLTRPFNFDGREAIVGASIGISQAEPGENTDSLIRNADIAMYVAKTDGGLRVMRFEPAMRETLADRMDLEADLRVAVEHDHLQVYYQPLVDLTTGELVGAEALLRWPHETRGMITPGRFIPLAEEVGLIGRISQRVLQIACRDAMAWRSDRLNVEALHVAVNLSGRHLQAATVIEDVQAALRSSNLPASRLTIELTESVMIQNADEMVATMRTLKALGVTLALDDFGTGYSSLSHLQRFPIDVLKLDRSFISALGDAEHDDALTRAILSLGESLGLETLAEGIETEEQYERLRAMGCRLGQGYLMSRPMAAEAFAALVAQGGPSFQGRPGSDIAGHSADRAAA